MTPTEKIHYITKWVRDYANSNYISSLVVGISGGVDSAVVSTLCANTGIKTIAVSLPIKQRLDQNELSLRHGFWLKSLYDNVEHKVHNLTPVFNSFKETFGDHDNLLAFANTRSRLRMTALYQIAQQNNGIVVGTGNKVEDFGVGFFTKYGDGGVDISPIGDCMKSDVWDMACELGILDAIIDAAPTDGLWDDGRTDEDQLGMKYAELEYAMRQDLGEVPYPADRRDLERYREIRARNLHKMKPIPVCICTKKVEN